MLKAYRWELTSSVPLTELVARLEALVSMPIDFDRNLNVPPEYSKRVDETGFAFALTPVYGGDATLLHCSGRFIPCGSKTRIEIELRPARWLYLVPVGMGLLFGGVVIWGLHPLGIGWALGIIALLGCFGLAVIVLHTWTSIRSCKKQIEAVLSA